MAAIAFGRTRRARGSRLPTFVVAVAAIAAIAVGFDRLGGLAPLNPLAEKTVDRSQPAVLHALADVSRYQAATATYSVVVDLERDAKYLPDFVKGERSVLTAVGSVDAFIDFGHLDESTVLVTDDGAAATVILPGAVVGAAHLDMAKTHLVTRDRGILDRIGSAFSDSPTSEKPLLLLAETKVAAAAGADRALVAKAEANTRSMVKNLLAPLGFETVTVRFTR